jgi:hypothetical protein
MKRGDLVTFGDTDYYPPRIPPIGILLDACVPDMQGLSGHVVVLWLTGGLRGESKAYQPSCLIKIRYAM